jgi:hypothetical protein
MGPHEIPDASTRRNRTSASRRRHTPFGVPEPAFVPFLYQRDGTAFAALSLDPPAFFRQTSEVAVPLTIAVSVAPERDPVSVRDAGLQAEARAALRSSRYRALWELQCQVREGVVIVSGVVASFYLKQMAQTVLLRSRALTASRTC